MRLAIADPPYPPQFSERRDLAGGGVRIVSRSRARRWYGDGPRDRGGSGPADFHPDAGEWDDPARHRQLLAQLLDEFDGWAIATTPDGLSCYHPLPVPARIMAWTRPRAMPTAHALTSSWEPVIVYIPEGRRARRDYGQIPDVLTASPPGAGFVGAKPAVWTRWVLSALGYDPAVDELVDMFPGSGAVAAAADGLLPLPKPAADPQLLTLTDLDRLDLT